MFLFERVENKVNVGKEEKVTKIFSIFLECFQKPFAVQLFELLKIYEPFLQWQIPDPSKLEDFADANFKFDENGRKFCKRVENTVWKRIICSLWAISPFPTVFSKDLYSRPGLVWERVKRLTFHCTIASFTDSEEGFWKHCEKRRCW